MAKKERGVGKEKSIARSGRKVDGVGVAERKGRI